MHFFAVKQTSPLDRFYRFGPITVHGAVIRSIEHGFWASFLMHHSLPNDATTLLHNSKYDDPVTCAQFARSVIKQHSIRANPDFLFHAEFVYRSLMIFLMEHGDNPFYREMNRIKQQYGTSVTFLQASGRERIWGTGFRNPTAATNHGGVNMYGKTLDKVLQDSATGAYDCIVHDSLLFTPNYFPTSEYRFTALYLGDSQFGQLQEVDGARIKAITGATFKELAKYIEKFVIDLKEHRYLVVSCGTNDSQCDRSKWEGLFAKFETILRPFLAKDRDHPMIAIIGPVRNTNVPNAHDYSCWLEERVRSLDCSNVFFFNFSGKHPDNPLVGPNNKPKPSAHLPDRLPHVNHIGLHIMFEAVHALGPFRRLQRLSMKIETHKQKRYPHGGPEQP